MTENAELETAASVGRYPAQKGRWEKVRSRQVLRLGALAATCLSWTTPSAADAEIWAPGAGLFVGYSFGKAKGIQVGLEAFALGRVGDARYQSCGNRWSGAALGPLAQLSLVGGFNPQLTVAGTGLYYGRDNFPAIWGEAGLSYIFRERRFGLHSGLVGPTAPVHLNLHHEWLGNSTFVGVGARTIPYLQDVGYCEQVEPGRPLRTDASELHFARALCGVERWSKRPAARAWQRQAQGELESVPAFFNLAVQLLSLDAPDELVERALSAAEEELAHAKLCIGLAREVDATTGTPKLPQNWSRTPLLGDAGFERLAVEAWLDGIVNEGASALASEAGLSTLRGGRSRPALARLAREERNHLRLAQDILTYATTKSPRARAAVEALGEQARGECFFAPSEEVEGFAPAEMIPALVGKHERLMRSAWREAGLVSA